MISCSPKLIFEIGKSVDMGKFGWPVFFSVHAYARVRLTIGALFILCSINSAIRLHLQLEALAIGKPGHNAL